MSDKQKRIDITNTIVDQVLDEVLAIDGAVRAEGLFPTSISRIRFRNSIKETLNKNYGYNLRLKTEDKDELINELKKVLEEDEDSSEED